MAHAAVDRTAAEVLKLDTAAAPELIRDTIATALVAVAGVTTMPNYGACTMSVSVAPTDEDVSTAASTGRRRR